jgi:hypothetical protein
MFIVAPIFMIAGLTQDTTWHVPPLRALLVQQAHLDHLSGKAYLGRTEKELLQRLGEPTSKQGNIWTYAEPFKVPALSGLAYQAERVVEFKDGRVVSAPLRQRCVG